MVVPESAVYCTLLLSDSYLPGAVVLAHSLRDNGTHAKLAALYTPDTLQTATINELRTVFDILIPVYRMTNHTPANLWLMERPDLIATFTKIELWRQTQFERIVYIDCDVVALRAPDELLKLEVDFAAAPDVGWPDCFNSGVMVLRPNLGDYYALKALAERGISFDGADQGLLNMHFRNWHRLSFTYNCTPSANYQYIPAYKHFQSTISLIHFIGSQKPWNIPRQVVPVDSPYNQLLGRWWAIYDRHYGPAAAVASLREQTSNLQQNQQSSSIRPNTPRPYNLKEPVLDTWATHAQPHPEPTQTQRITKTSFIPLLEEQPHEHHDPPQPELPSVPPTVPPSRHHPHEITTHEVTQMSHTPESTNVPLPTEQTIHHTTTEHYEGGYVQEPVFSVVPQYVRGEEHVRAYIQPQAYYTHSAQTPVVQILSAQTTPQQPPASSHSYAQHQEAEPVGETIQQSLTPPPQQEQLDQAIFEPPRAEWDASREPPPLNTKPEGIALEKKTYAMSEDHQLFQPPASYPDAPKNMYYEVPTTKPEPHKITQIFPWEHNAPKPTRVFADDEYHPHSPMHSKSSSGSTGEELGTSQASWSTSWTSDVQSAPSESWESYSRSNAWDEVPEIRQYIQSIQKPRRAQVQVISGRPNPQKSPLSRTDSFEEFSGTRITDFPSEVERPSLPVTPAPIRRPRATGSPGGEYSTDQLPAAEGVPNQEDWNPSVRLEELWRRQSEVLENPDLILERISKALGENS